MHSQMEASLTTTMMHLLGTNPGPAITMIAAITSNKIKQSAYLSVAKQTLDKEDFELFEYVLSRCAAADRERNRIAHDLWATEAQLPASVILISAKEYAKIGIEIHLLRKHSPIKDEDAERVAQMMRESGLVYNKSDFVRIQKQTGDAFYLVTALSIMLDASSPDHEVANKRNQLQVALQEGR